MPKNFYPHMSVEEREIFSLGLAQGYSLRTMARGLHSRRSPTLLDPWLWHDVQAGLRRGCPPNRLPGVSGTSILRTCGSISLRRRSPWRCICCHPLRSALLITPQEIFAQLRHHSLHLETFNSIA